MGLVLSLKEEATKVSQNSKSSPAESSSDGSKSSSSDSSEASSSSTSSSTSTEETGSLSSSSSASSVDSNSSDYIEPLTDKEVADILEKSGFGPKKTEQTDLPPFSQRQTVKRKETFRKKTNVEPNLSCSWETVLSEKLSKHKDLTVLSKKLSEHKDLTVLSEKVSDHKDLTVLSEKVSDHKDLTGLSEHKGPTKEGIDEFLNIKKISELYKRRSVKREAGSQPDDEPQLKRERLELENKPLRKRASSSSSSTSVEIKRRCIEKGSNTELREKTSAFDKIKQRMKKVYRYFKNWSNSRG